MPPVAGCVGRFLQHSPHMLPLAPSGTSATFSCLAFANQAQPSFPELVLHPAKPQQTACNILNPKKARSVISSRAAYARSKFLREEPATEIIQTTCERGGGGGHDGLTSCLLLKPAAMATTL